MQSLLSVEWQAEAATARAAVTARASALESGAPALSLCERGGDGGLAMADDGDEAPLMADAVLSASVSQPQPRPGDTTGARGADVADGRAADNDRDAAE